MINEINREKESESERERVSGTPEFLEDKTEYIDEDITEEYVESPKVKKLKKKKNGKMVIAFILIILLSVGAGFGGGLAAMYFGQDILPSLPIKNDITIKPVGNINTAEAVAEKVIPSVVGISTKVEVSYQSWFGKQKGMSEGVGTGIIVDENGYILTNSHVVSDGSAETIIVQLTDGREVAGEVLWNDKSIDLAIVKIEADNLTAAELGDSEKVRIGSYAVAIGNPLGLAFDRSVTQGVISGLNRSITLSDGQGQTTVDGLMQTDASINSGNSGGPLLNSEGEVIGINTAKAQSGEGLGFAIPINTAKPIVQEIKTKGEFKRAYIGIRGGSVSEYLQAYPEENLGSEIGVYVAQIYEDSPAAKSGVKEGDIIIGVNDNTVETMTQLISDLFKYRPGDTVKLKIVRDLRTININVVLTEMAE